MVLVQFCYFNVGVIFNVRLWFIWLLSEGDMVVTNFANSPAFSFPPKSAILMCFEIVLETRLNSISFGKLGLVLKVGPETQQFRTK